MIPGRRKIYFLTPRVRHSLAAVMALLMFAGLGLSMALSGGTIVLQALGFGLMLFFAFLAVWIRSMRARLTVDGRSIRFKRHPFLKEETIWVSEIERITPLPYPEWLQHPLYQKNSRYLPEALKHPLLNGFPALYIRHRRGEVLINLPKERVPGLELLIQEYRPHGS